MARIAIVFFDAGGGHRAAAHALLEAINQRHGSWSIELVSLDDILEPVDPCYRLTGLRGSDWYNWWLRWGWTYGSALLLPIAHTINRMLAPLQTSILRSIWRRIQPDLIVSMIPHFNGVLYKSLRAESRDVPFVTILTDFADYPPHFWIENQSQHYICGTPLAAAQVSAISPGSVIWQVSGMIVHPRFYQCGSFSRAEGRRRLGLEPHLPTAIVLFGGRGSRRMLGVARYLKGCGVQAIFLTGRNRRLAARLRAVSLPFPAHIEDFTENVADLMQLGDFFVGKAGPGSVSEALVTGLPVIVESNLRTPVHERYNIKWIRDQGLGLTVPSFRELPATVGKLLDPVALETMRQRIQALNNRAVFEVLDILVSILQARSAEPMAQYSY
jgi:UDP-N-acetylglucosamine:LPS N-acetylglucosamine transferase